MFIFTSSFSSWNYSFKTNTYVNGVQCATTSGVPEYVAVFRVSKLLFMELWPIWVVTALLQITGGEKGPQTTFTEFLTLLLLPN